MQIDQTGISAKLRILVAPLDWGLGHATRCIPLIRYLLKNGCHVDLAGEGSVANLLQANFPHLKILPLQGYRVRYSKTAAGFAGKIIIQIPSILKSIQREQQWLERIQLTNKYDLIISDNRYGLSLPGVHCLIMTHQLRIRTGMGQVADKLLQKLHYRLLEKFKECWIVDNEGADNLAGQLSSPGKIPSNGRYIGILSQLYPPELTSTPPPRQILLLISGPEPARRIFEEKILAQIKTLINYRFTVVGGNLLGTTPHLLPDHIEYHTHLHAKGVQEVMEQAELVICRSGYSTLMDLAVMGKKALLIPTPGQTEQQYLARQLSNSGRALWQDESRLNLEQDIYNASLLPGFPPSSHARNFEKIIDRTITRIQQNKQQRK